MRSFAFTVCLVALCAAGCGNKTAPTESGPPPASTSRVTFSWNEDIGQGDCNYSYPKWTVILSGAARDSFVLDNNNRPPTFCEWRDFQRTFDSNLPLTIRVIRSNADGYGVDTSYTYPPRDSLARVWPHTCEEQPVDCQCVPATIILGPGRIMSAMNSYPSTAHWPPDVVVCTPRVSTVPNALDFGSVPLGSSVDMSFQLRNESGCELTGTVSSPCPDFRIVYMNGNPVPGGEASYLLGGTIVFIVRFTPTATGQRDCTLDLGWGATVSCTGSGTSP